jgi:hypothetical protein
MARVSNAKAKEKKQKIVLAVGGVLLLGLLAFQGPKFLKLMKGSSTPAAAATSTSSTEKSPTATSSATLIASTPSGSALATSGKLASLSLFRAKDPFVQLVSESGATSSAAKAAAAPPPPPPPAPAPAPAPTPAKASTGSGPLFGTVTGGASAGSLPTARILLNGAPTTVALGHSFPAAKPVFRLAGVLSGGVSISLVDGGLADGASAVKLQKGQSMTLMNTVDRRRYTIKLVATKGS